MLMWVRFSCNVVCQVLSVWKHIALACFFYFFFIRADLVSARGRELGAGLGGNGGGWRKRFGNDEV